MARSSEDSTSPRRRGCLMATLVIVVLGAAIVYFVGAPIRQAKQREQVLNDTYGWAETYAPRADGSIPRERMDAFIRVREAVVDHCSEFQDILDEVMLLDEIESDEGLPPTLKATRSIRSFGKMFTLGPKFLAFADARNGALETEQMGLGEYIHIYLTVYGEMLAREDVSQYREMEEAYVSDRTLDVFVGILENQLAAGDSTGADVRLTAVHEEIREEIRALRSGSRSSPWPDGVPAGAEASVAPYRERLMRLYCPGIVKIELLQKNRGLRFDG
ncbi:MAG: hypothetical protein GY838_05200 [bacterium]|nr:hypothetical protein [bacterium]